MKREVIYSAKVKVPKDIPLSQGIKVGNVIYLSSMVAFDPKTGKIEAKTIEGQTHQSIRNCREMLRAGGATLGDVVRVMILLKNPRDFEVVNRVYGTYFRKDPPARTVVKIGAHIPKVLISIMMTAVITDSGNKAASLPELGD